MARQPSVRRTERPIGGAFLLIHRPAGSLPATSPAAARPGVAGARGPIPAARGNEQYPSQDTIGLDTFIIRFHAN